MRGAFCGGVIILHCDSWIDARPAPIQSRDIALT
jgi:hypothetical protein